MNGRPDFLQITTQGQRASRSQIFRPIKYDAYRIQMRFMPLGPSWEWHNYFTCQDEMAAHISMRTLRTEKQLSGHDYRIIPIG